MNYRCDKGLKNSGTKCTNCGHPLRIFELVKGRCEQCNYVVDGRFGTIYKDADDPLYDDPDLNGYFHFDE